MGAVTGDAGQSASANATPKAAGAKNGLMRFSTEEEIILLKEVIASGAHVARYGKKEKNFDEKVDKINLKSHFRVTVKTRTVQDKFNNMLNEFHKRYRKDRKKSGFFRRWR